MGHLDCALGLQFTTAYTIISCSQFTANTNRRLDKRASEILKVFLQNLTRNYYHWNDNLSRFMFIAGKIVVFVRSPYSYSAFL